MKNQSPPTLILVVGMHRSGTSLLGSMLQAIGIATPGELIAGDGHNPEGYFERRDITDLQEQLLISLGRWWPGADGMRDLPPDWLTRPETHQAAAALRHCLAEEQRHQHGPWAIKDPRSSLLLPLWRRVCGELQIPLRLLLAVRDPAEVATSLCRRDAAAAGMTAERAERLWWRHHQAVFRHSGGLPLGVIHYSRWFRSPEDARQQVMELLDACGQTSSDDERIAAALEQIKPEHRRSRPLALPGVTPAASVNRMLENSDATAAISRLLHATPAVPRGLRKRVGGWFDPEFYRRCNPDLQHLHNPLKHYLLHGWQRGCQPHPLFDPQHYLQSCIARGLGLPSEQSPLEHFLTSGIAHQISCTPLLDPDWFHGRGQSLQAEGPPTIQELHPWGAAALAIADHDQPAAAALLRHWQHHSLSEAELNTIAKAADPWLRWPDPAAAPGSGQQGYVIPFEQHHHWRVQGWLNQSESDGAGSWVLLKTGEWPSASDLERLRACAAPVHDPDPHRCAAWRRLGLEVVELRPPTANELHEQWPAQIWLQQAGRRLGLPDPRNFKPGSVICLGAGSPEWNTGTHPDLWLLPGFDQLQLEEEDDHRALAAWLFHSVQQGCRLVRLHPDPAAEAWAHWLPIVPMKPFALTAEALLDELAWRDQGRPAAATIHTPRPEARLLWSHDADGRNPADAAVLISLFNYADRIERALDSVAKQSLPALELLVVDDASSDAGAEQVLQWLEQHGHRFQRAQLWQHGCNGGLAAARNTAFDQAQAEWCMVLDADNTLDPTAVETCLSMTQPDDPRLAVVHPLIRRRIESVQPDRPAMINDLVSRLSWQRTHFAREGNNVDAMALIRRSAWQEVGGFHHIPGGWEDFDFWCCLIDAGYHGVLCPRPLATYSVHGDSMLQSQTNRDLRRLSRLLEERHPWLQLPLGHEQA